MFQKVSQNASNHLGAVEEPDRLRKLRNPWQLVMEDGEIVDMGALEPWDLMRVDPGGRRYFIKPGPGPAGA